MESRPLRFPCAPLCARPAYVASCAPLLSAYAAARGNLSAQCAVVRAYTLNGRGLSAFKAIPFLRAAAVHGRVRPTAWY